MFLAMNFFFFSIFVEIAFPFSLEDIYNLEVAPKETSLVIYNFPGCMYQEFHSDCINMTKSETKSPFTKKLHGSGCECVDTFIGNYTHEIPKTICFQILQPPFDWYLSDYKDLVPNVPNYDYNLNEIRKYDEFYKLFAIYEDDTNNCAGIPNNVYVLIDGVCNSVPVYEVTIEGEFKYIQWYVKVFPFCKSDNFITNIVYGITNRYSHVIVPSVVDGFVACLVIVLLLSLWLCIYSGYCTHSWFEIFVGKQRRMEKTFPVNLIMNQKNYPNMFQQPTFINRNVASPNTPQIFNLLDDGVQKLEEKSNNDLPTDPEAIISENKKLLESPLKEQPTMNEDEKEKVQEEKTIVMEKEVVDKGNVIIDDIPVIHNFLTITEKNENGSTNIAPPMIQNLEVEMKQDNLLAKSSINNLIKNIPPMPIHNNMVSGFPLLAPPGIPQIYPNPNPPIQKGNDFFMTLLSYFNFVPLTLVVFMQMLLSKLTLWFSLIILTELEIGNFPLLEVQTSVTDEVMSMYTIAIVVGFATVEFILSMAYCFLYMNSPFLFVIAFSSMNENIFLKVLKSSLYIYFLLVACWTYFSGTIFSVFLSNINVVEGDLEAMGAILWSLTSFSLGILGLVKEIYALMSHSSFGAYFYLTKIKKYRKKRKKIPGPNIKIKLSWFIKSVDMNEILGDALFCFSIIDKKEDIKKQEENPGYEDLEWGYTKGLSTEQIMQVKSFFFDNEGQMAFGHHENIRMNIFNKSLFSFGWIKFFFFKCFMKE